MLRCLGKQIYLVCRHVTVTNNLAHNVTRSRLRGSIHSTCRFNSSYERINGSPQREYEDIEADDIDYEPEDSYKTDDDMNEFPGKRFQGNHNQRNHDAQFYGKSNKRRIFDGRMDVMSGRNDDFLKRHSPKKLDLKNLPPFEKNFYKESAVVENRTEEEVDEYREKHQIVVRGDNCPKPLQSFTEYDFPDYLRQNINNLGFDVPTPIQSQGIPIALSGKDLVGIGQTGSGKTAAFIIPALVHIQHQEPIRRQNHFVQDRNDVYLPSNATRFKPQVKSPIVLVVCPTRELSVQVRSVVFELTRSSKIRSVCLYGGASRGPQIEALERGCEIVVATPGRLIDILGMDQLTLDRVTYLVLDEADRMLDMGFEPQIRKIFDYVRPDRQVLMWSATWPQEVRTLSQQYLNDSIQIGAIEKLRANPDIDQNIVVCKSHEKEEKLFTILNEKMNDEQAGGKALIFCQTKARTDQLASIFRQYDIPAAAIHGDKSQRERTNAIENFRRGASSILLATDVAARGLDIPNVNFVINYDLPTNIEDYIHRIGRTARAGNTGTAISLFTENDEGIAGPLIKVIEEAGQQPPSDLKNVSLYQQRNQNMKNRFHNNKRYQSSYYNNQRSFNKQDSRKQKEGWNSLIEKFTNFK